MSRFGLSLGFGDKTVKEVCELNGVDCRTLEIKKINMRLTQIIYQSWNGNFSVISIQPGKTFSKFVNLTE